MIVGKSVGNLWIFRCFLQNIFFLFADCFLSYRKVCYELE